MTSCSSTNIRDLFLRISNHDIPAYEELFQAYYDPIYSTVLNYCKIRELAEDITQQIFLKVWERRASLPNVDNPLAWLYTAARYQVLNALDREILREKYITDLRNHFQHRSDSPVDLMIRRQQAELYQTALQGLSPRQLEVYRLSREQGLTYEKIAERLGIGRETVKDYMATALRSLKTFFRKNGNSFRFFLFLTELIK